MVIKTVYKTTDGKSFDTMKDAMSHQNDLDRSDEAYPDCRAWQMKNGKPYPKSSCYECGSVLNPNFRCKHGLE